MRSACGRRRGKFSRTSKGTRNRAIHAHEPRGVRFLLDPNANTAGVPRTVSSMVFIEAGKIHQR